MEMQQMLAHLLAEMRSGKEKAEANLKEIMASMRNNQETLVRMEAKMEAAIHSIRSEPDEKIQHRIENIMECKESTLKDKESTVERRAVPTEEAAAKSSRIMKKWHRGRHLAAGRRVKPKKLTQGDCGSRWKLAAACRKVSRRAAATWRKRNLSRNIRTSEEINRRWQEDNESPYKSGMAQERRRLEKLDQGQSYARNPESRDAPGRQNGRKGPRRQMAALCDEGKDINHRRHQRVEIGVATY
jgi:hypothetical protein